MEDKRFDLIHIDAAGIAHIVEYKRNVPPPQSFTATVASIANSGGGYIFIGVDEKTHQATGVNFDDKNIQELRNAVQKQLDLNSTQVDFEIAEQEGKKVIKVDVKKSQNVVIDKKDGAVYEYKEGKEVRLKAEEAAKKILATEEEPNVAINRLIESNENLIKELRHSNSWRAQWKKLVVTFLSGALTPILIFVLNNLYNREVEKNREKSEVRRLAAEVRPFIETNIEIGAYKRTPIPAPSHEAAELWRKILLKQGTLGSIPTKVAYVTVFNHGKGKAIQVTIPLIIKVWGRGQYTKETPYQFVYEFEFRNLDPGHGDRSVNGLDISFFPFYRIERPPIKVIGLPELNISGLELEYNPGNTFESENNLLKK